ncbi:hypothetical protein GGX14DRAFT_553462 [Mycena pura]|uniref:F-box domain-containing protein n=1 Tax=Mycena pura TaxID=153505 RepID=A0AAD6YUD7_9AGAR|nr:hypothetical protein GGX14DRAFT_553462 [Mycena pura]
MPPQKAVKAVDASASSPNTLTFPKTFPLELTSQILKKLSYWDLLRVLRACKPWKRIIETDPELRWRTFKAPSDTFIDDLDTATSSSSWETFLAALKASGYFDGSEEGSDGGDLSAEAESDLFLLHPIFPFISFRIEPGGLNAASIMRNNDQEDVNLTDCAALHDFASIPAVHTVSLSIEANYFGDDPPPVQDVHGDVVKFTVDVRNSQGVTVHDIFSALENISVHRMDILGDTMYVRPPRLVSLSRDPEVAHTTPRFALYRVSDMQHVVVDTRLNIGSLIDSERLEDPSFRIEFWYAQKRQEDICSNALEVPLLTRYLEELEEAQHAAFTHDRAAATCGSARLGTVTLRLRLYKIRVSKPPPSASRLVPPRHPPPTTCSPATCPIAAAASLCPLHLPLLSCCLLSTVRRLLPSTQPFSRPLRCAGTHAVHLPQCPLRHAPASQLHGHQARFGQPLPMTVIKDMRLTLAVGSRFLIWKAI